MKKRNKTLIKRLLASSLALTMCLGMACTSAFAAGEGKAEDYVYVYINVTQDAVEEGEVTAPPTFDAGETPKPTEADEKIVTDAKSSVETKEEENENSKLEFNAGEAKATAGLTETAEGAVTGALEALETAKPDAPEYTAPSETEEGQTPDPSETALTSGESGSGEGETTPESTVPANKEFVDGVTGRVDALNQANTQTQKDAGEAQSAAQGAGTALKDAEAKLNEELSKLTTDLTAAKTEAESTIEAANSTIAAYEVNKKALEDSLASAISDLGEKPAETFRERGTEESEADYVAAQNAWVKEYEDYNAKVADIQSEYGEQITKLGNDYTAAQNAAEDAQKAIDEASKALEALNNKGSEGYSKLEADSTLAAIEEYNKAVEEYQKAANGYNNLIGNYDKAATDYNTAVDKYNQAIDDHNTAADTWNKEYDKTVSYYNETVEEYTTKVEDYNQKVDSFNTGDAKKHNSEFIDKQDQITVDTETLNTAKDELGNQLDKVTADDIQVFKDFNSSSSSAWTNEDGTPLTDEEYNAKVDSYNKVVAAYNAKVDEINAKAVEDMLGEVDKYFGGDGTHPSVKGDNWYTLGRINVAGIFDKTPKEIRDGLDKSDKDFNADETNLDATQNKHPTYYGRDMYYFDKDGNLLTDDETSLKDNNLYKPDQNVDTLKTALSDNKKFEAYGNRGQSEFDPHENISRWVLKVSYGASDYQTIAQGKETFHLDAYVRVDRLSQLATLEKRAVNEFKQITGEEQNAKHITIVEESEKYGKLEDSANKVPEVKSYSSNNLGVTVKLGSYEDVTWNHDNVGTPTTPNAQTPGPLTPPDRITVTPPTPPTPPTSNDDPYVPPVIIDDEDVPLVETPVVDVPEPEVPLAEEPVVDIPEEEVPLIEAPEEVEIPEEDVPLADVPKTGDISAMWYAVTLLSACGLAILTLRRKENG